jgi:hypothetical protein
LRGLSTEGLKVDLVNRLQARLDEEEFGMIDAPISVPVITDDNTIAIIVETPPDIKTTTTSEIIQEDDTQHDEEPSLDPTHDKDMDIHVPTEEEDTSNVQSSGITTTMTLEEKLKSRAERFQISESSDNKESEEETEKKRKRAERFLSEEERKKQLRAKRFQTSSAVSDGNTSNDNEENDMNDNDDEERKKQLRAKRFQTTKISKSGDMQQYSNDDDEEEKQKKLLRAKRFQQSTKPNTLPIEENGNQKKNTIIKVVPSIQDTNNDTLPSKEELEKRLARLEKFGKETNKVAIDEIKGMLRKHRFH